MQTAARTTIPSTARSRWCASTAVAKGPGPVTAPILTPHASRRSRPHPSGGVSHFLPTRIRHRPRSLPSSPSLNSVSAVARRATGSSSALSPQHASTAGSRAIC
ncbi:hypothetical protein C8R44DRAFT_976122 [Mycena epipterygia]|nr:hypothetical protein C8R44DRAFT_976122 [Mycena epipterygia]